jgi:2-polyprenyl-3-methyl-5-hydroxy-6-metoxy-1,4-benzoquinol methylase
MSSDTTISYHFEEIVKCEMCDDLTDKHKIIGQRLNKSQGMWPRKKSGITVSIKKCTKCKLVYSSPQPVPFDIQDHYGIPPESYWKPEYFNLDPEYFATQIKVVKNLLDFRPGMKALDIGAGIGKCMISLEKAGFDTYGFEPSRPYYERALSKMNIKEDRLKLGMIEQIDYNESSFDFINFGAVFEHLYHPASCLEKVLKWLKPGGIIHIEVPSSKYLATKLVNLFYRLTGTNYVSNLCPMHVPFHLYEFDYKSFESLSTRLGYEIKHHEYYVANTIILPVLIRPLIDKYMKWTNSGMQLTVWLSK